jgi:epoxide hydrolase
MAMKKNSQVTDEADAVTSFQVHVPQVAIDDLKQRLAATRWPEHQTVGDWSQGAPLDLMKQLLTRWQEKYDWRRFEERINQFPQFRTTIDGLGIHFLHVRSRHESALPIILTHSWPGSIIEFLNAIGPLVDPKAHRGKAEDAFHVVIPSLPGHGFSDKPSEPGWDRFRTARAWSTLMTRLGYTSWVAQGGDWGSIVTHVLAQQRPPGLLAAHVNMPLVLPVELVEYPTEEERAVYADIEHYADSRGARAGYFSLQATRPQTIAYALLDSPAGQAAWIYEKLHDWTDHEVGSEAFPIDEMLDGISIYWFTGTAGSAARFYWENMHGDRPYGRNAGEIELPMAATVFPKETVRPPKAWAEALWPNLFYWNVVEKGGHLAAWEQAKIYVEELRKAFRSIRPL